MTEPQNETLREALTRYGMSFPDSQVEMLERYCQLVWDWNQRLNLTRHTDYDKFVSRDVLDTVQVAEFLKSGEEVLDVGTGGGVPGIVLAIIRPDLQVSLCDSVGKKAAVLDSMIETLKLPVPVHRERAEKVLDDLRFDALIARAVGPLWKMCTWFKPHWHHFGRLLAIKGPSWTEERGEARHRGLMHGVELRKVASYPMPGTESESVILCLTAEPAEQ